MKTFTAVGSMNTETPTSIGNKRPADEDLSGGGKRSKGENEDDPHVELRILLQSKNAGAVIGKAGNNIKRLRTKYNATVTVPDCCGPERILTIAANQEAVLSCLLDVIPVLEEYQQYKDLSFDCEIRMLVHQSKAGAIIGRAGFKIKELREETGATIKVYSDCCPTSTERVVQISGVPDVVITCVRSILAILNKTPTKGPTQLYDPYCHDDYEYGGYSHLADDGHGGRGSRGGRRGGGGMMGGPPMGGPRMNNRGGMRQQQRGGGGGFQMRSNMRGSGGGGGRGGGGGMPRLGGIFGNRVGRGSSLVGGGDRGGDRGSGGRRGGGRLGGGGGSSFSFRDDYNNSQGYGGGQNFAQDPVGGSNFSDNQSYDGDQYGGGSAQVNSTQVTIPKDLAGSIIGRGGSRIRTIRNDSGAKIKIDEPLPGSNDRVITISGSDDQIQNAQYLLQLNVRQYSGKLF